MSTMLERRYRRQHLNCVRHITLDPKGRGVVRIHMIPPREDAENAPFLLLLNGSKLVPLNLSWAILLSGFMDRLEPFAGLENTNFGYRLITGLTYFVCYMIYANVHGATMAFGIGMIVFAAVYVAAALLLAYHLAPRTFKLRT